MLLFIFLTLTLPKSSKTAVAKKRGVLCLEHKKKSFLVKKNNATKQAIYPDCFVWVHVRVSIEIVFRFNYMLHVLFFVFFSTLSRPGISSSRAAKPKDY